MKLLRYSFLLIFLWSCDEDSSILKPGDPSDLEYTLEVADDGSGTVTLEASAQNAIEYTFDPGESGVETLSNTTGSFTHTYSITGVYQIELKVFGESGRFLLETATINVTVGEDSGPIDGEDGYITPLSYDGYTMIWQDEFNGNGLNTNDWNYEIGRGSNGWGNNELQYYREDNTSVSDGFLIIEAKQENFSGAQYTSSRLTTEDKFEFQYGRVDIRAKLPKGQGIWPALWMLGANFRTVGWPNCGEIDIMELVGGGDGRDDTVHGTIHWDNNGSYANFGRGTTLSEGIFNDKFHVFTIIWTETSIRWFVDDRQYNIVDITPGALSEFRDEFFFIFNVAVGGNWPGSPNAQTVFPQQMVVDYVRVFQEN